MSISNISSAWDQFFGATCCFVFVFLNESVTTRLFNAKNKPFQHFVRTNSTQVNGGWLKNINYNIFKIEGRIKKKKYIKKKKKKYIKKKK